MACSDRSKPRQGPVSQRATRAFSSNRFCGSKPGSKCALPSRAVRYPAASRRYWATDGASTGSGIPLATTPWVRTYWPVRIVERAGMHTVFWL